MKKEKQSKKYKTWRFVDVNLASAEAMPAFVSVDEDREDPDRLLSEVEEGVQRINLDKEFAEHGDSFLAKFKPVVKDGKVQGWEPLPAIKVSISPFVTIGEVLTATVLGPPGKKCKAALSNNLLMSSDSVDEEMSFTLDDQGQADLRVKLVSPGAYFIAVDGDGMGDVIQGSLSRSTFDE